MPRRFTRSRSRLTALGAAVSCLALLLAGCGGDSDEDGGSESSGWVEPEYDGLPADLTSDEVCALLDEGSAAEMLEADVLKRTPGSKDPDCTWLYKLPGGPATALQVQVMSMAQTEERLGTEALEWGLSRAPEGSEVTEVAALDVPNGSYEFGASTVVYTIDPVGRLITVTTHSDTSEEARTAVVEAVLEGLAAEHT